MRTLRSVRLGFSLLATALLVADSVGPVGAETVRFGAPSSESAQLGPLQRIIVSDGARVAMAPGLEEAVAGIFGAARPSEPGAAQPTTPRAPTATGVQPAMPQRALQLLDQAERALRSGDYAGFGRYMNELRQYLRSQQ